jgi:H+/Cl- antiporter ClcA
MALASVSITLPLPGGSFVPLICAGSIMGRLVGELIRIVFPTGVFTGVPMHAGVCATVGAAAMLTGATHCLSSAVIVFELTGQLNLLSPLLIGTITAYYIAKPLSLNLWDQITLRKGLPFLPDITPKYVLACVVATTTTTTITTITTAPMR